MIRNAGNQYLLIGGKLSIIIICDQTDKGELYAFQSFGLRLYLIKAPIGYLRTGIRWKFRLLGLLSGVRWQSGYLVLISKPYSL